MNSLWNDAVNWVCQHPVDDVFIFAAASLFAVAGLGAHAKHKKDRKEVDEILAGIPEIKPINLPPPNSPSPGRR